MALSEQRINELLVRDHERIRTTLEQVESMSDEAIGPYFDELCRELVHHETAEELTLYPAFKEHVAGADSIADAVSAEQDKAEARLAELAAEDRTNPAFRQSLAVFRSLVIEHTGHEERALLKVLETHASFDDLVEIGRRYEAALGAASQDQQLDADAVLRIDHRDALRDAMRQAVARAVGASRH